MFRFQENRAPEPIGRPPLDRILEWTEEASLDVEGHVLEAHLDAARRAGASSVAALGSRAFDERRRPID